MPEIRISKHARGEMDERGITEEMLMDILNNPAQVIPEGSDKEIYHSIMHFSEEGQNFLVRVFVNILKVPNLVITVYRTSKIEKYWRDEN